MKRIVKFILVLLICFSIKNVYAENYKIKELIPRKIDTTIHTKNFSYIGMFFDNKGVHFNGIRNLTDEKKTITISIGLFNNKGKNVGVINYCEPFYTLNAKSEMSFIIGFDKKYLGKNVKVSDIKYMAVLDDNSTCKTKGSRNFIGQSIDKMGISHSEKFDDQTELLLSILTVLGGALVVFILYKLIFNKKYRNIDGKAVRKTYDEINRELKEKREEELKNNPIEEEIKITKSEELIKQEEDAKNEEQDSTDLHNLYK